MQLLTDLDCLAPPLTGIGHYTRELSRRLLAAEQVESITAMYHGGFVEAAGVHDLLKRSTMITPSAGGGAISRLKPWVRRLPLARSAWQGLKSHRFAKRSRRGNFDVYWEPNFILKPAACPSVVTIYDLSPLALPALHPASRIRLLRRSLRHSVERAERIVTISHFTASALNELLDVPHERICLVPPAAGEAFYPRTSEKTAVVRTRYGLPAKFILSVGTLEPRKNLSRLLQAYERLPHALRAEWPLVCVGAKGWRDDALTADVARLEARGELIRLGYVAQADLPELTAAAGLVAYMSVYEGFGMPVVEALASGVAVLTSTDSAMAEIACNNAFYAAPYDVDSITAGLEQALTDSAKRRRLAESGPAVARRYDWNASAQTLLEVFNEVRR